MSNSGTPPSDRDVSPRATLYVIGEEEGNVGESQEDQTVSGTNVASAMEEGSGMPDESEESDNYPRGSVLLPAGGVHRRPMLFGRGRGAIGSVFLSPVTSQQQQGVTTAIVLREEENVSPAEQYHTPRAAPADILIHKLPQLPKPIGGDSPETEEREERTSSGSATTSKSHQTFTLGIPADRSTQASPLGASVDSSSGSLNVRAGIIRAQASIDNAPYNPSLCPPGNGSGSEGTLSTGSHSGGTKSPRSSGGTTEGSGSGSSKKTQSSQGLS